MIARSHRFHGYNSLRHVYGRGKSLRTPYLTLKYLVNERRSGYRAAVVVSRKIHKSAVVRARIRRRIYEIIRGQEPNIQGSFDIVLIVQTEQIATMPASELEALVQGQLAQARIIPTRTHAIVDAKERA